MIITKRADIITPDDYQSTMRAHILFRDLIQKIRRMAERKEHFSVRLSQAALSEIDELVKKGIYPSRNDFISRAAYLLLHQDQVTHIIKNNIREYLQSEEGRELLREALEASSGDK